MMPTSVRSKMRLVIVGLAVAAVGVATLPSPQAAADHTPLPGTVTLVGSLQSELGCPGDWQPECDATHLQPVAGEPGVFRGTFTVPAGGFEYKVGDQRVVRRELRRRWRRGWCEYRADGAGWCGDVHLRPQHPCHCR